MDGDAVHRTAVEAGAERRRKRVLDAFGGDADQHDPIADERSQIVAIHDLAQAPLREGLWTAPVIEQHLVSAIIELDVGAARLVERLDHGLAKPQIIAGTGRQRDVFG